MAEIAFVMAHTQNHFFAELVEVIRDELTELGVSLSVHLEGFPTPRAGLVYALVPPHEYYALRERVDPPSAPLLRRSIFICAEQPESHFFTRNIELAADAGAIFDISRQAVTEWRRRGVSAEHFPLGYTRRWDRSPFGSARDVDIAFVGSRSDRRSRVLAGYAPSMWRWRAHLLLSDNSRPNYARGPDFRTGEEKRDLLARTKVLLNIHVDERRYCETLRVVEAVLCGAVVVSEHSIDSAPLVEGIDFVSGRAETLALLASEMLEDDERREGFAARAFAHLRDELPLRASVERLAAVAADLDARADVPSMTPVRVTREQEPTFTMPGPPAVTADPDASAMRRALKQLKLEQLAERRRRERFEARLTGAEEPGIRVERTTGAYRGSRPRVSVVVSLHDYEHHIEAALGSVSASSFRSFELVVVDDASNDASLDLALAWCDRNEELPTIVLHHAINRGLPYARNAGIDFSRGDLVFILDADNEVYPHCLARLVEALDVDDEAAFAYGMADRFDNSGPLGLLSIGAWEPARLRYGNYIDAMAMVRRQALLEIGGYTTEMRLHGWEDYDLWCGFAERGWRGHAVREVLGRYRVSSGSMLGTVTGLSATDAFVALADRHPELMGDVVPPL